MSSRRDWIRSRVSSKAFAFRKLGEHLRDVQTEHLPVELQLETGLGCIHLFRLSEIAARRAEVALRLLV
jgi:hypothetical protein